MPDPLVMLLIDLQPPNTFILLAACAYKDMNV